MVSQRRSTNLAVDERQLSLLIAAPKKVSATPDLEYIKTLPNFRRAVRYSISLADLEPKQVYEPMGMDKAIFSRIDNGGMSFPADDILKLREITGNNAPLLWLNHQEGIDIRNLPRLLDDKDREIKELKEELAEKNKALSVAVQLISGKVP